MKGEHPMKKATYLAVFEPSSSGFGVYFPDLPGCISAGSTCADAQLQAADALGLHLYGMEKDADIIPAPSEIPQIDPETTPGYIVTPITIFPDIVRMELDTKSVKTNITLPAWLKEIAEAEHVNFSKVLQAALIDVLGLSDVYTHNKKISTPALPKSV
jgi:predicted RNase H-like HicB family nuclease